jgi:hypothetical protein
MANYPQELAKGAVCQNHTGHMTRLWFLPARPLRLNTNELLLLLLLFTAIEFHSVAVVLTLVTNKNKYTKRKQ